MLFVGLVMFQVKMAFGLRCLFCFVSFIIRIKKTKQWAVTTMFYFLAHMWWLVNNVHMRHPETLFSVFSFACTI